MTDYDILGADPEARSSDVLHSATIRAGIDAAYEVATGILVRKFREQGVQMSRKQVRQLRNVLLEGGDLRNLKFRNWRFWEPDRQILIEITPSDLDELERESTGLLERFTNLLPDVMDQTAAHVEQRLIKKWPAHRRHLIRQLAGFENRLRRRWAGPLSELLRLLTICRELAENIAPTVRSSVRGEVMLRLQARACQVTAEIVTLLNGGFADGALARWRTLHEIAAVMFVLLEHDDQLAQRYLDHVIVKKHWAAEQFDKYHEALGEAPRSDEQKRAVVDAYQAVLKKYEVGFADDHGWARLHVPASNPSRRSPTFADIEVAAGIAKLRPYYGLASTHVHANAQPLLFKLGLMDGDDVLLVGPSDIGLADPGQNAALSLAQVTIALGQLFPTVDVVVSLKIIDLVVESTMNEFATVHRRMVEEHTGDMRAKRKGRDDSVGS